MIIVIITIIINPMLAACTSARVTVCEAMMAALGGTAKRLRLRKTT
jgi:hypothetical protein